MGAAGLAMPTIFGCYINSFFLYFVFTKSSTFFFCVCVCALDLFIYFILIFVKFCAVEVLLGVSMSS